MGRIGLLSEMTLWFAYCIYGITKKWCFEFDVVMVSMIYVNVGIDFKILIDLDTKKVFKG